MLSSVMVVPVERLPEAPRASSEPVPVQVYVELLRTHEALSAIVGRFFQEHGVTPQQFNVLRILADDVDGEGLPCSSISDRLVNRVPDITRLLDRLERAGLVRRYRDSRDRRVVRASLTDEGGALVERMNAPLEDAHSEMLGHLAEDELDLLALLLRKARRAEGTSQ